jgi:hypothetical protein
VRLLIALHREGVGFANWNLLFLLVHTYWTIGGCALLSSLTVTSSDGQHPLLYRLPALEEVFPWIGGP